MEEEDFKYNKKSLNSSHSYCINLEKMTIQDLTTAKESRSTSQEENKKQNTKENQFLIDNYINRKTKRGRKEKLPFPKNEQKCGVCLEFSEFSSEGLFSCSICKCFFHLSCYSQLELDKQKDNSSYLCTRCSHALRINININEIFCFICGCSNGVLNKNSKTNEFYHQICLYFLIELQGLNEEDIKKDKIRKWRYKNTCRYCGEKLSKKKAVIKCKNTKCKQFFHIPCSIEKGMIFDLKYMKKYYNAKSFSDIPFFCSNHNKRISFLYKNFILSKKNENKPVKKSTFFERNIKNEDKKENIEKKIIFKVNKKNKNKFKTVEITDNNNEEKTFNQEKENEKEKEVNIKEDIDSLGEKNEDDIFYMDIEKIIKDNCGNNKNIFVNDFEQKSIINKIYNDDNFRNDNEENSSSFLPLNGENVIL